MNICQRNNQSSMTQEIAREESKLLLEKFILIKVKREMEVVGKDSYLALINILVILMIGRFKWKSTNKLSIRRSFWIRNPFSLILLILSSLRRKGSLISKLISKGIYCTIIINKYFTITILLIIDPQLISYLLLVTIRFLLSLTSPLLKYISNNNNYMNKNKISIIIIIILIINFIIRIIRIIRIVIIIIIINK